MTAHMKLHFGFRHLRDWKRKLAPLPLEHVIRIFLIEAAVIDSPSQGDLAFVPRSAIRNRNRAMSDRPGWIVLS
ncbi:MAG: hypothetical protein JMDDDDMK_00461 [Acidobacteria bacterium]|nr:hypothetical protein [Acidobacteriota bacterium]